jgi:hypothetical protein
MTDEIKPFRIAIRAEGEFVNAYFASPTSMENAQLVASIRRAVCDADEAVFDAFKDLVRKVVSSLTKRVLGAEPIRMEEEAAPEHERAGHS